jgi:hypothetical protein
MISFKRFLSFLEEGKHSAPGSDKELFNLLDQEPSSDKNHPHYEDKIHNAIKALSSDKHGKETVAKYLDKHSNSSNRWVRLGVAKHKELSNHPDIHSRLKTDTSALVVQASGGDVSKKPSRTSPQSSNPNLDTSIHPEGKYDKNEGSEKDFPGADKVTHLVHKTQDGRVRKVASIVSQDKGHHIYDSSGKKQQSNFSHKSHNEALLRAMQNDRDARGA